MSEKEITWNTDIQTFEPCTTCLDIAFDAANSGGFKIDDDDVETIEPYFDDAEVDERVWENPLRLSAYNDDEPPEYKW